MEKQVFTVGDRTDKFCAVCAEERGHIVTSVSKRGQISRVSCSSAAQSARLNSLRERCHIRRSRPLRPMTGHSRTVQGNP
jgi:hypothetical protein